MASAVWRWITRGIRIKASSSRVRSLKNATPPINGPSWSPIKIAESEYQPKPDAMAKPSFQLSERSGAANKPASSELSARVTAMASPRRFNNICLSGMPELRSWQPIRTKSAYSTHSASQSAVVNSISPTIGPISKPNATPAATTPTNMSDPCIAASLLVGAFFTTGELPAFNATWRDNHHRAARLNTVVMLNSSRALPPNLESWLPRFSRPARLTPINNRIK